MKLASYDISYLSQTLSRTHLSAMTPKYCADRNTSPLTPVVLCLKRFENVSRFRKYGKDPDIGSFQRVFGTFWCTLSKLIHTLASDWWFPVFPRHATVKLLCSLDSFWSASVFFRPPWEPGEHPSPKMKSLGCWHQGCFEVANRKKGETEMEDLDHLQRVWVIEMGWNDRRNDFWGSSFGDQRGSFWRGSVTFGGREVGKLWSFNNFTFFWMIKNVSCPKGLARVESWNRIEEMW